MTEEKTTVLEGHWLMETYRSGGDPEKVLAICRDALEEAPLSLGKRILLGRILQELGRTEEARRELEHVERLMQRGSSAHLLLADMERVEGRLWQAARQYIQALALDSSNDTCWAHLREINAALADALQQVFDLRDRIRDEARTEQKLQVKKEKPGPEQILATMEGWLANIRRLKSKLEMGVDP